MTNYKVIDSDNYKASGIGTFFFPGGEPHAKIPDLGFDNYLLWLKLRTWDDVGRAVCVLDAISQQVGPPSSLVSPTVKVFLPYFPGARQDRSDGRSPLTKYIMEMLLCRADFQVNTFDLHSVTSYDIARNWMPSDLGLLQHIDPDKYEGIIAPDAGAGARAKDFASALHLPVFTAEKTRDFATGRVTGYKLPELPLRPDGDAGHFLVVDDICDGGATFNMLADAAPEGVDLDLWVSHGIFSKGVNALSEKYETIYTTDSWHHPSRLAGFEDENWPRLKVISLKPLFDKIMES